MEIRRYTITAVSGTDGKGTIFAKNEDDENIIVTGQVVAISYVKDETDPFTDGVDFTVRANSSVILWGENDVNSSKVVCPMVGAHDQSGGLVNFIGGERWRIPMLIIESTLSIELVGAGNTKTGHIHIYIEHDPFRQS